MYHLDNSDEGVTLYAQQQRDEKRVIYSQKRWQDQALIVYTD